MPRTSGPVQWDLSAVEACKERGEVIRVERLMTAFLKGSVKLLTAFLKAIGLNGIGDRTFEDLNEIIDRF